VPKQKGGVWLRVFVDLSGRTPPCVMGLTMNVQLDQALWLYDNWGAVVFPVPFKTKKARITWGHFRDNRPSRDQVIEWFKGDACNIAVLVGRGSNELSCIDFDTVELYQEWSDRNPELALRLPTVRTHDGYHVYFRSPAKVTKHLNDLDLKASGYMLGPGSIHPEGTVYQWVGEPTADLPRFNSFEEILGVGTEHTEHTEHTEPMGGEYSVCSVPLTPTLHLEKAISKTLPTAPGQRNRQIFQFCRELKSLPEYCDKPASFFKNIMIEWHRQALATIRTTSFDETWVDFIVAWGKVAVASGVDILEVAYEQAKADTGPFPDADDALYTEPRVRLLLRICLELSRVCYPEPFWISCRDAGRLIRVKKEKAGMLLRMFAVDGLLKMVKKTTPTRSPRYVYTGKQGVVYKHD
jgi:hypothetical protein